MMIFNLTESISTLDAMQAVDMIKSQSKRSSNNYPFAAVGVNLTLLIGELAMLRDRKFENSPAPFWGVFEHSDGFFEVDYL